MPAFGLGNVQARLLMGAALAAIIATTASAQPTDISLPEQPLADALTELSRRTGENILFQPESLAGIRAPALKGHMSPDEAVRRLLQGTGLRADTDGRGGLIVQRDNSPASLPGNTDTERHDAQIARPVVREASAPRNEGGTTEEVVVTGWRVTIAGYAQPTPSVVIDKTQLERDAFTNINDALRDLPQFQAPPAYSTTHSDQGSQGTGGTNFANLRLLGVTRTLVLFDSQRMVSATAATNVDITTLPSMVISRVDVVTGGASAAWGSDAVAGVVNFIIDKNITGFKAEIQGGDTYDGKVRDFSVKAAWGSDFIGSRGHVEFAADAHIRPDYEMLTDRPYYKGAYWVSNPAYVAGNGQPQLIVATNVGEADATAGGIINASAAGAAGPGVTNIAPANALRGIQFVGQGVPEAVDYGNLTRGVLSNGGSFTERDSQAPFNAITQPISTYSWFGYGRYQLTDNIQASIQGNFGYATGKGMNVSTVQTGVVIKADNAFLPPSIQSAMTAGGIPSFTLGTLNTNNYNLQTATGANFSGNAQGALSPAIYINRRNVWRAVFTLSGTLGNDWSWTAYILHAANRLSTHDLSVPIVANLTAAEDAVVVTMANRGVSGLPLGSIACRSTLTGAAVIVANVTALPGCVPLNIFGTGVASKAALDYVTGASNDALDELHQSLQLDVAEASMQGKLPWGLQAGKIATAFGVGYRRVQGVVWAPPIAAMLGYGQGNSAIIPPSQYNVLEGFGELDIPLLKQGIVKSLDLNMAGRMTSYSTSGLVETWKLGVTSQIDDNVKLRATYSVDIRAPQINELFSSGVSGSTVQIDPRTQQSVFVFNQSPGNPNLNPEVANTVSGGVVFTPSFIPGLNASADWYSISLKGVITSVSVATIVRECTPLLPSVIHPGQNGNPNDPLCASLQFNGPNGALSFINSGVKNFASQTTSGLDIAANYDMDFWGGTLSWMALANLNDESTFTNPGVGINDSAGSQGSPKWRGILQATYKTGPISVTAEGRWFGTSVQYQDGNSGNQASASTRDLYDPAHFEVPFTAYLDLRGDYRWNGNTQFFGAIDNAINTPPPLVAPTYTSLNAGGPRFDSTNRDIYDEIGRNFRVGVRFTY
jgi:outer membrane receptor protein involved in Fe transport